MQEMGDNRNFFPSCGSARQSTETNAVFWSKHTLRVLPLFEIKALRTID